MYMLLILGIVWVAVYSFVPRKMGILSSKVAQELPFFVLYSYGYFTNFARCFRSI